MRLLAVMLPLLFAAAGCSEGFSVGASPSGGGQGGAVASSSSGSGTAGGPGEGGAGGACADGAGAADHDVLRIEGGITLDGECDEPAWDAVSPLTFLESNNGTNNAVDCRFLWEDGGPDRFYGCCHIEDHDLRAPAQEIDGELWRNDALEYFLAPKPMFGPETQKIFVSGNGVFRDAIWNTTGEDTGYSADVVLATKDDDDFDGEADDTWYRMEWRTDLPLDIDGGRTLSCNFDLNDTDGTNEGDDWIAFGNLTDFNQPSAFGTCRFACDTVP